MLAKSDRHKLEDALQQRMVLRERLAQELAEVDDDVRAIERAMSIIRDATSTDHDEDEPAAPTGEELCGLSVPQALLAITRYKGGILYTREASAMLVEAGAYTSRSAAGNAVHSAAGRLVKSKSLRKTAPGCYRLVEDEGAAPAAQP